MLERTRSIAATPLAGRIAAALNADGRLMAHDTDVEPPGGDEAR